MIICNNNNGSEVMGVTRGDGTGGGNCGNFNFMTMFTICFLEHTITMLLCPIFVLSLVRTGVQGPFHHNCKFYEGLSS